MRISDWSSDVCSADLTVQALKDEVPEFNSEAASAEVDAVLPDYDRLNVYLSVKAGGLLLQDVTVTLDNHPAELYHYDEFDSRAILGKNPMQRLIRVSATTCPHRVPVTFNGNFSAPANSAHLRGDHANARTKQPRNT